MRRSRTAISVVAARAVGLCRQCNLGAVLGLARAIDRGSWRQFWLRIDWVVGAVLTATAATAQPCVSERCTGNAAGFEPSARLQLSSS